MTDYTSNKFERDGHTGALISRDIAALNARKKEIANRKRLDSLEKQVVGLSDKMDVIIKLLSSK